jgi:BON domain
MSLAQGSCFRTDDTGGRRQIAFNGRSNKVMTTLSTAARSPAAQALCQSSHPALRSLTVQESDAAVIISGRVSRYYLKQLAQEVVMQACSGVEVVNRVTVVKD